MSFLVGGGVGGAKSPSGDSHTNRRHFGVGG